MKQKQKKQINDLINALEVLGYEKNKDENFLPMHIDRAICNPFKISYIRKNDLENMLKIVPNPEGNTGYTKEEIKELKKARVKTAKISAEIREKFFKATSIEKFFKEYFLPFSTDAECTLFSRIIEKFKLQFYGNMNFKFEAFKGDDIAKVYANELDNFTVLRNGSCMQNEPVEWFEIYTKCEDLEILTLYIDKKIIARGLLWKDREKENDYFLDRIYISTEFDEDTKEKIQTQLYFHALKYTKKEFINCSSIPFVLRYLRKDKKTNVKEIEILNDKVRSSPTNSFSVDVDGGHFDSYPYADTFKNYEIIGENSILSADGEYTIYLDQTDGHDNTNLCAACDGRIAEDEERYSETDDCSYCDDCCTWLEDRETYTHTDNAREDTFRTVYVLADDIE